LLIFSEDCQGDLVQNRNIPFWQSSKKIERLMKANQPRQVISSKYGNICSDNEGMRNILLFLQRKMKGIRSLKKNTENIRKGVLKVVPTQQNSA
jgi:hypothetical protein